MSNEEKEEKKYIDLEEARAMIYIPRDAIEATISVKVYVDGEVKSVAKDLDMRECQKAIRDAELNYMEDTDMFELTDKERAYHDALQKMEEEALNVTTLVD